MVGSGCRVFKKGEREGGGLLWLMVVVGWVENMGIFGRPHYSKHHHTHHIIETATTPETHHTNNNKTTPSHYWNRHHHQNTQQQISHTCAMLALSESRKPFSSALLGLGWTETVVVLAAAAASGGISGSKDPGFGVVGGGFCVWVWVFTMGGISMYHHYVLFVLLWNMSCQAHAPAPFSTAQEKTSSGW